MNPRHFSLVCHICGNIQAKVVESVIQHSSGGIKLLRHFECSNCLYYEDEESYFIPTR